jgi:CheY-like chemotaxis protein/nitrogen-specific signal transduction histidine kinase
MDKSEEILRKEIVELKKHINILEQELRDYQEKSDASNHLKSMFLANISHEIRTPMNGIIGMYNVLKQTNLTEEQQEFLDIINLSGNNLLTIIDDILDLSKIEAGQLILEENHFNLSDEVNAVLDLLEMKAKGKGIKLYTSFQNQIPNAYIGDQARLKQILINLTNNAIKYTKEGSVTIKIEAEKVEKEHCEMKFSIIDTGIGISKQGQEKLFKAFSQIDSTTTRKYGGTGLGLAIAKNLTTLMGGDIGVESEEGKGSTFWFTAKMMRNQDKADLIQKNVAPVKEKEVKPLNILLVEDNLLNQKFAIATLRKEGHKIDIAENGKIAINLYKKKKYDLILMDIQMPVMDGIEATKEIRKIEMSKKIKEQTKIIAITAYVMERDRSMCLGAGMNEYLAKPFKPNDLIHLINSLEL